MSVLLTIYWILFLVGLGFAVVSAVFMGFGEMAGGGTDIDTGGADGLGMDVGGAHGMDMDVGAVHGVDLDTGGGIHVDGTGDYDFSGSDSFHGHGEVGLNPISPITLFAFMGGFGGGGLIGTWMGLPPWGSLLIALPLGFLVGFGIYYLMYKINISNISSEARAIEVVGISGELITPIVDEGTGEVAYVSRGSRYVSPARSIDGKSISKGRPVKVWRIVGSTCFVKEILPEEADEPGIDTLDQKNTSVE